ncbi:hypothetical protein V6N13_137059 [Hibiscus sabdariffa]
MLLSNHQKVKPIWFNPQSHIESRLKPTEVNQKTCNKIESLVHRFIWGSSSGSSALSLVDWSSVCQPLSNGGLGLRSLRDTNLAFLLKLCNTLIEQPDCFWVSLLRNKYHMTDVVPLVILRANCSALWRAISSLWAFYTDALEWSLDDGLTICFCTDVWVLDLGPLVNWKHQQVHIDLSIKVASLTTTDGDWNWSVLNACLLPRARARFRQLFSPQMTHGPDRCYWPGTVQRRFTVKSAYKILCVSSWQPVDARWNSILKLQVPERLRLI